MMELFFVKDKVELLDLEKSHARFNDGVEPVFFIEFDLKFPDLVRTVDQSESGRELAGKLREVVKRNFKEPSVNFTCSLCRDYYDNRKLKLRGEIYIYGLVDENLGDEGLELIFGYGRENFKLWMTMSFCHLPEESTPVSKEALFNLEEYYMDPNDDNCYKVYYDKKKLIKEIQKFWSHQTGFMYAKLRLGVELNEDAVKHIKEKWEEPRERLNKLADQNRKMLEEEICTDLEVLCGDGKVVKCHKAVVGVSSKVFQNLFQGGRWEEGKTGRVRMEEMSEKIVRAVLRWIYWRDEKEALGDSDVAVEMLIAGDKYQVEGLAEGMREIVLERRGYDEMWFGVESAVELYGWARNLEGLKEFKEKAVHVLKFFEKTCPEKLVESGDYQELIKNDAVDLHADDETAMETSEDN